MKGLTRTFFSATAAAAAALLSTSCIVEHTCADDDMFNETITLKV